MDKILENLLALLNKHMSRKQVIAVVGLFILLQLRASPTHVAIVTVYAITAQTVLDYRNPNKENANEKGNNNIVGSVPDGVPE